MAANGSTDPRKIAEMKGQLEEWIRQRSTSNDVLGATPFPEAPRGLLWGMSGRDAPQQDATPFYDAHRSELRAAAPSGYQMALERARQRPFPVPALGALGESFVDEARGVGGFIGQSAENAGNWWNGRPSPISPMDAYHGAADAQREANADYARENPYWSKALNVAGGLAARRLFPTGPLGGAASGGAQGFLGAEGDLLDRAPGAAEGVVQGALKSYLWDKTKGAGTWGKQKAFEAVNSAAGQALFRSARGLLSNAIYPEEPEPRARGKFGGGGASGGW